MVVLLLHQHAGKRSGEKCHDGNRCDRPAQPEEICDESGTEGADGVAQVAPEPVHTERTCTPARMCNVRYDGKQARVDHGSTHAEQQTAAEPAAEPTAGGGQCQTNRLDPHAGYDEALATPPVAQGAGDRL